MNVHDHPASEGASKLQPKALDPLPLGQIRPTGWLRQQLAIQAGGLTGHLDEFWPDVADSRWIGGNAEGWERGPYWLDGLVPLAFLLDDDRLKHKAHFWVDQILARQNDDGWLGPVLDSQYSYPYDTWPRFVVLKALAQYHEATGDERIVPAIKRFLHKLDQVLDEHPLRSWAYYRWGDLLHSIHWLYERTGDEWLLGLGTKVHEQGFDWRFHFERFPYREKSRGEECDLRSHGPNNAMAVKAPAVWFRQNGDPADREAALHMIRTLDRYHGQATGMFTCDEHLAGLNPSQGSELCAVVEYMFSLEVLLSITGEPTLADLLEQITYNALPATLSPNMWARQYDQQVNQVQCVVAQDRVYTSNSANSNIYGLEPHFGCCTPNLGQGWPKFASHLWMRSSDGGLAVVAYAPCTLDTTLAGVAVHVDVETNYPFAGDLRLTVGVAEPTRFPLHLRVPAWAEGATLVVDGGEPIVVQAGTFHRVEREWGAATTLSLRLPMVIRATRRFNNSVSIYRGPLLFGLQIGEDWRQIGGELPHADWEVLPTTPWNYALAIDPDQPEASVTIKEQSLAEVPFSPDSPPLTAKVLGRRVQAWDLEHSAAAPVPLSPVQSDEPTETLTLLPYGATNLRVAEFPVLAQKDTPVT